MADTIRGPQPNATCSDCGGGDVCMVHWGPLVPPGKQGAFCAPCWMDRQKYYNENGVAKPMKEVAPAS